MARISHRVRFAGGSGFELAGIVDRPDDRDSFPVVVFSHCFTCNKDLKAIVRISRALADRGIGVLRFDMTGLGGSQGEFAETNFSTNLADLHAAIRFATQEIGTVTGLVGHSFGGSASLGTVGRIETAPEPDFPLPKAVVTLAAPSETQHLAQLLARMDPRIEATGTGSVKIGGVNWEIHLQMLDDFRQHDLPASISRIEAATLLFHSPVDATLPFDHALRIMGLIQNRTQQDAHVSLISLDGADHLLVDPPADLEFVAATTAAFLNRYAEPG